MPCNEISDYEKCSAGDTCFMTHLLSHIGVQVGTRVKDQWYTHWYTIRNMFYGFAAFTYKESYVLLNIKK